MDTVGQGAVVQGLLKMAVVGDGQQIQFGADRLSAILIGKHALGHGGQAAFGNHAFRRQLAIGLGESMAAAHEEHVIRRPHHQIGGLGGAGVLKKVSRVENQGAGQTAFLDGFLESGDACDVGHDGPAFICMALQRLVMFYEWRSSDTVTIPMQTANVQCGVIDKNLFFETGVYKARALYVKANPGTVYGGADSGIKFGRFCYKVF